MSSGFNLDARVDVGYFDDIVLAPGTDTTWWFTWDFDARHWQRMAFAPISAGRVTIVSEWITHTVESSRHQTRHVTTLWARLHNPGDTPLTVTPSVLLAPSRYR